MFSWVQSSIPLSKQLEYYKECQTKLVEAAGQSSASSIISDAIYLISAGTSDFVQNYYINPLLNKLYTTDQFSDILLRCYSSFIQARLSEPWHLALEVYIPLIEYYQKEKEKLFAFAFADFDLHF